MLFQATLGFLDEVEQVAALGAREIMRLWGRLSAEQIDEKGRNDLVTAADRASEAAILTRIRDLHPHDAVLAEESGGRGDASEGPVWIIDPLDGTTNFVHGFPHFAVSVGVAVDGVVQAGVILDPLKGDVFRAARGQGAWHNGRRCRTSGRAGLAGALLATGFPFRAHRYLEAYLAIFRDAFLAAKAVRRPGAAALDLAYVAAGIFDGFFEFKLSPWDLAAGALLVEESGGRVSDMDGCDRFLASGNLVCGSHGVHRELMIIVDRHRPAWRQLGVECGDEREGPGS